MINNNKIQQDISEGKPSANCYQILLVSGLEISNFTVRKKRFRTKKVQGNFFESGFIVSSNSKSSDKPLPQAVTAGRATFKPFKHNNSLGV